MRVVGHALLKVIVTIRDSSYDSRRESNRVMSFAPTAALRKVVMAQAEFIITPRKYRMSPST